MAIGDRIIERFEAISRSLDDLQQQWALIGGIAVGVRSDPVTTRDIDVAVAVRDDEAAEQLIFKLGHSGYRPMAGGTIEQTVLDRLSTQRLMPPGEKGVVVDLLFASSGIEAEVVQDATRVEVFRGLSVPVASRGHLIALKTLSLNDDHRPKDRVHLRELLICSEPGDLAEAQAALSLIEERGCNRKKDLQAELHELCRRHAVHLVKYLDHNQDHDFER